MQSYCHLDPQEKTSVKFELKKMIIIFIRKKMHINMKMSAKWQPCCLELKQFSKFLLVREAWGHEISVAAVIGDQMSSIYHDHIVVSHRLAGYPDIFGITHI